MCPAVAVMRGGLGSDNGQVALGAGISILNRCQLPRPRVPGFATLHCPHRHDSQRDRPLASAPRSISNLAHPLDGSLPAAHPRS